MKKVFLPILAWGMFNGLFAQMTISPSWSIIQSPNFNLPYSAGVRFLDAVDPNVVWATGYHGTAADVNRNYCFFSKTSNGGTSWTSGVVYSSTATPAIGDTNTYVLANLDAIDANTAWVAAYMKATQNKGAIHRTTDGGATWVNMNAPGMFTNSASFCNLVCFVTNSIGIVQGDPNPGAGNEFEIWRTTDGGNTWSLVPGANIPNPLSGEYGFVNVYEKNGNSNIWFGTNKGRIFRSTDAGQTWSVSTALANSEITRIAFYDANNGLCVAYTGSSPNFTLNLLNTNNGGATWNLIASGNSVDPNFGRNDVCGIPGTSWFASAGAGTGNQIISFSMDNGLTWNSWGGANIQYLNVDFVNSSTGWAGSFSDNTNMGGIFKYSGPNMQMPANANFSSASTVCVNAPFTPTNNSTGNPAPSYTWAVSPAATISSSTAANPTITFPSAGIYTITLTAANTLTTSVTSKTVNVSTCAGIQEVKNDSPFAMIYPVPAKDQLVIALNYKAQKTLIEVKDLVGRTVKIIRVVNSNSVASDISDLSPGAYFLQINEGGNTYVKKFIKE